MVNAVPAERKAVTAMAMDAMATGCGNQFAGRFPGLPEATETLVKIFKILLETGDATSDLPS